MAAVRPRRSFAATRLTLLAARCAIRVPCPPGHPQGYADCFDAFVADFYEAVRSGSTADGMPTFSDGLRAVSITDAVLVSSREERWVDLPGPMSIRSRGGLHRE